MVLRIGYVREHFSSPLLQFAEEDKEATFTLVECPSGTGQLISCLANDEIDVAIALTDPLISGIANGSKAYKLVGSYVSTPLNWAVITGVNSEYTDITQLKGTKIGISRYGSGSHTMAYVLALQQGWPVDRLLFQVNNNIDGLVDSVKDESTSAFMWEWFTTKPYADAGQVRFIGSVPTPWPSWLIAAHPERARVGPLGTFLKQLTTHVRNFKSPENRAKNSIDFIKAKFCYPEEDIRRWLETVDYSTDCQEISAKVLFDTLGVLQKAGVVKTPEAGFQLDDFVNVEIAKLTQE